MTNSCGNRLSRNNVIKTLCEMSLPRWKRRRRGASSCPRVPGYEPNLCLLQASGLRVCEKKIGFRIQGKNNPESGPSIKHIEIAETVQKKQLKYISGELGGLKQSKSPLSRPRRKTNFTFSWSNLFFKKSATLFSSLARIAAKPKNWNPARDHD